MEDNEKQEKQNPEDNYIGIEPTFAGSHHIDDDVYMKFNNAVRRMAKPRDVEKVEVDVEFINRNVAGSIFAVAIHHPDGVVDTEMLLKINNQCWCFHRGNFRYSLHFVKNFIASIWGYKKVNDLQIAKELCDAQYVLRSSAAFVGDHYLRLFPGGVEIIKCVKNDEAMRPNEALDFIPYERFAPEALKDFYSDVVSHYALNEDLGFLQISDGFVKSTIELSIANFKEKMK